MPSATSYPSGRPKRPPRPVRTPATRSFTGRCRCEVPIRSFWLASLARASGLTFDGPQPNRPSSGLSAAGISTIVRVIGGPRRVTIRTAGLPSVALGSVATRLKGPAQPGAGDPRDLDLGVTYVSHQLRRRSCFGWQEPADLVLPLHRRHPMADRCLHL